MRLLFSVNNFGFLRNFEPALRLLAARGHDLHLVAERKDSVGGTRTIDNLLREYPDRVTFSYAPSRKDSAWQPLAVQLRLALDYWRYLDPAYDHSPSLRARGERQAPAFARWWPKAPLLGSAAGMRWARAAVRRCERAIPAGDIVERFLAEQRPDLLLLTPLLYFGSQQVEYVRAARAAGIRTVLGVGSWDHLTTKGLIHEEPDRIIVWNEMQRSEAETLHGIDPANVTVTGAQAYDHWFTQRPGLDRAAFCAMVGVPADRPLLLYLCSSPFITPHEVGFVRRWIEAIRSSASPDLRRAAILIRPHPQNAAQWSDFDPSAYEAVGLWPRAGANPVDAVARTEYYDSMYHSVAVVGVNTSALIESGIVGRPVYSVLADEFSGQQEGTLHFQHLKNVNGGLLHVGSTLEEHLGQLAIAVSGVHDAAKSRAFVAAFVRPRGVDVPAAEWFVQAVEAEASLPRGAAAGAPNDSPILRRLLKPMALLARRAARRRKAKPADGDAPAQPRPTRILFALASPEYLRYFDSTMRLLADRGHHVAIAVSQLRERKHARLQHIDDPRIDVVGVVPGRGDVWDDFARGVRGTMDFVRYLHPRFADTPALRDRMYRKVLPKVMRPLNRLHTVSESTIGRMIRTLQAVERAVPVSRQVSRFLAEQQPDVLVVSPLIDAASDQVDLVRAARASATPVVAAIASWDNLTNKGLMRVEPDVVTVWNEFQKAEAIELHGVDASRVQVTGAQLFDRWFERAPSQSRADFCVRVGLPDARPFVLFTGSSVFIARSEMEVPFVRRWIEALRASDDPVLRDAAVLVRPHPFNPDAWITADFSDLGPVAIWPRQRYTPASEESRTSFFDSLFFADAVVGINTSAMIEAAILRKPVLSLLTPEFAGTQEGTIHFRYLLPEHGGFLRVANSVAGHVEQLREVLTQPDVVRQQTERFVERFLRPHGLSQLCTPILADAIASATTNRPADRDRFGAKLLRTVLLPLVWFPLALAAVWPTVRQALSPRRFTHRAAWSRKRVLKAARVARARWGSSVHRLRRAAAHRVALTRKHAAKTARRLRARSGHSLRRSVHSIANGPLVRTPRRAGKRVRGVLHVVARAGYRQIRRTHAFGFPQRDRMTTLRARALRARMDGDGTSAGSLEPGQPTNGLHYLPPPDRRLRVLFAIKTFLFLRLFDPVVRELASRGHAVHLLADNGEEKTFADDQRDALAALQAEYPNVTYGWAPRDVEDDWIDMRLFVRYGLDYLRFLGPSYRSAPVLAARAVDRTPATIVALAQRPLWRTRPGRWLLTRALRIVERAVPVDSVLEDHLLTCAPDVLLVSPLVALGSEQQDMIRIARQHGVASALCVASWDHLSSKAIVRVVPNRVFVWNDVQKAEAVRYHGVAARRVVVTGAQCFDWWFDRRPARDREAFCARVGLDPRRPIIVYVCSALFEGSPVEAEFVLRWIETLRAAGDRTVGDANILVRPHPKRGPEWTRVELPALDNVTLWPAHGQTPLDEESQADYFDTLYHAAAVVGINTSALIEASIVGRPVHTILLPEFRDNQEGTLHFRYLLEDGWLMAARSMEEHVSRLAASLNGQTDASANERFVRRFVRPLGTDVPATPVFVAGVERLGETQVVPRPEPWWVRRLRLSLEPRAVAMAGTFAEWAARERRKLYELRERRRQAKARRAELAQRIAEQQARRAAARETALRERQARRDAHRAEKERLKQVARQQRIEVRAAGKAQRALERAKETADRRKRTAEEAGGRSKKPAAASSE